MAVIKLDFAETNGGSEDDWQRTKLALDNVRQSKSFDPRNGPNGAYRGHHVIGRDTRIANGVSVGSNRHREPIVVLEDEQLQNAYKMLRYRIDAATERSADRIVALVYAEVKRYLPYKQRAVDAIRAKWVADGRRGLIPLSAFCGFGGVCRHQALLAGYLIERLIGDGLLLGTVSVDRSGWFGGAHTWTRYAAGTDIIIVDVANGFCGRPQDNPFERMYLRPGERRQPLSPTILILDEAGGLPSDRTVDKQPLPKWAVAASMLLGACMAVVIAFAVAGDTEGENAAGSVDEMPIPSLEGTAGIIEDASPAFSDVPEAVPVAKGPMTAKVPRGRLGHDELIARFDRVNEAYARAEAVPLSPGPDGTGEGGETRFGYLENDRARSTEAALADMERLGVRPATFEELVAFAGEHPDEQYRHSIAALGSVILVDGGRGVAILRADAGKRLLSMNWTDGPKWGPRTRFLVVRK